MSKHKQKFSFVVGGTEGKRSNIWHVVINKNDIYLMSEAFGKTQKIALHESGVCQSELTSEYMATTDMCNQQRFLDRWEVEYKEGQATIAFAIIFPNSQLISFPQDVQLSSDLLYISPPNDNGAVEVIFYKTGVYAESINASIPNSYRVLKSFRTENGEWVAVICHEFLLNEDQQAQIAEMSKRVSEQKTSLGIKNRIIAASFGLLAPNGERRICEIYV